MNRRLWIAVAAIVAVFVGVSWVLGPTPPPGGSTVLRLANQAIGAVSALPWSVVTILAGAAIAATTGLVWRERRRRAGHGEPWRTVITLGKQGRSISVIARDTGLTQDAVRIVLAPVALDPSFPRGNSFRSSAPPRPVGDTRNQPRPRP